MQQRPRATLGGVVDDLGSTLIDVIAGHVRDNAPIGGLVFYDPADPPDLPQDALVLAIGVTRSAEVAALVREVSPSACGVMVRLPLLVDPDLQNAVHETGLAVVGLARGVSWAHIAALLRSLLAFDDAVATRGDMLTGPPPGDLFALANAISELLDAPITIEDLNSTVVAFSADQARADDSRKEGILGRRVPERYTRELVERGIFQLVYGSPAPVFIEAFHVEDLSRAAVRITAGDEILGSMWAAVTEPLSIERKQDLAESAKIVALHLLRQRAGSDVELRLHGDLLATLLDDGPSSREAAEELGISGGPACVLAIGLATGGDDLHIERGLQRARGAFALHLSAVEPRSVVALVGGVLYAVIRVNDETTDAELRIVSLAQEFLERLGGVELLVGVSGVAADFAHLPRARSEALRALRVLATGQRSDRTARARDVSMQSLMLDLGDLAGERQWIASPALQILIDHDRQRGSALVDTMRAWLETFGDTIAASRRLHVHTNTFRYRLRRVGEVSGLDLGDPNTCFGMWLEIRLLDLLQP